MKGLKSISEDTMWKATVTCNPAFDGVFFYAIKTTGIFCRPSCKSKTPNYQNVSFFANGDEAQAAGYRPCKRCRPDLPLDRYDPLDAIITDTKRIVEEQYSENLLLIDVAAQAGVSRFHLHRAFKKRTGYTPRKYVEKIRINRAKKLLLTTRSSVTEIAFQVGFQSISSFNKTFKRHTDLTPSQFQSIHRDSS